MTSEGKWAIFGGNVPNKPNTPVNCELDWSMQWRAHSWADAWLRVLDESIISCKGGGRENAIRRRKSDIYRLPCWLTELRFNVPQNRPFRRCSSHPVLLSTNIIGLSHIYLMVHNLHVCIFTFIYGLELVCIWPLLACDSVIYYCDIISTITLLIMPWGNLVSNWPSMYSMNAVKRTHLPSLCYSKSIAISWFCFIKLTSRLF